MSKCERKEVTDQKGILPQDKLGAKGGLPAVVLLTTTPTVWIDARVQRKRLPSTNLHMGIHTLAIYF